MTTSARCVSVEELQAGDVLEDGRVVLRWGCSHDGFLIELARDESLPAGSVRKRVPASARFVVVGQIDLRARLKEVLREAARAARDRKTRNLR